MFVKDAIDIDTEDDLLFADILIGIERKFLFCQKYGGEKSLQIKKQRRFMRSMGDKESRSHIVRVLLFFTGLIIVYSLIGIAVIDDNVSIRLTYHDFYNQSENIDVVVVGTSRVYMGFNPVVFDESTGVNSFNLGTSSQTLDASYFVIKEAIERYDIETVFLSVEYDILTRNIGGHKNTWIISDYMRGLNRYEFILDVCDPAEWPMMFFRVYRYRKDISWDYCLNNIRAKLCLEFWKYENSNDFYSNYNYYVCEGFNFGEKVNEGYDYFAYKDSYGEFDVVSPERYNDEMIEYLKKSINLCKSNGVNLVLITMPETNFYVSQAGEYDLFTKYMKGLAEKFDISYFDFNLLADECFSDEEFLNLDHLTMEGAEHFSKVLSDIYNDSDSHEFYDSFSDDLRTGIDGVIYHVDEINGKYQYTWDVITKSLDCYRYKICSYSMDMDLIYESEIQERNFILFDEVPQIIVIEIYSTDGSYIGKAKLL